VLFFSQENMQNYCRQQEKRNAHPTEINGVTENTESAGLSSVCTDLPTRRYLKHCQRRAIHTARWYDYISPPPSPADRCRLLLLYPQKVSAQALPPCSWASPEGKGGLRQAPNRLPTGGHASTPPECQQQSKVPAP